MSAELVDLLRTLAEVLKGPRVLLGLYQASEGSRSGTTTTTTTTTTTNSDT